MKIGSHVSNNGDLMLALSVSEAIKNEENAFMVYLGPPQSTIRKGYDELNVDLFHEGLNRFGILNDDVIIHAPYIVNCASPIEEKRKFAIDFLTKELDMTGLIGSKYMVVHPGCHMNEGIDKGLERISDSFKKILKNTKNQNTCIAIETMAGKGSECCFEFSQIKKLIDLCEPYSNRVVVCFDTCHTFDSGYDLVNDYEGVLNEFDNIIGLSKIKVIHLNDSKNILGSKKDRHENIGFGNIGFNTLMKFVNDERFIDVPKILETPFVSVGKNSYSPYKEEIKMIKANKFNENLLNDIIK